MENTLPEVRGPRSNMPRLPKLIAAIALLQTGIIIGLVLDSAPGSSRANAQIIPDPAAQQMQTNEILRGIDSKLQRITDLLASGDLKVKAAAAAEPRR